jgi:hypothetical protein
MRGRGKIATPFSLWNKKIIIFAKFMPKAKTQKNQQI